VRVIRPPVSILLAGESKQLLDHPIRALFRYPVPAIVGDTATHVLRYAHRG